MIGYLAIGCFFGLLGGVPLGAIVFAYCQSYVEARQQREQQAMVARRARWRKPLAADAANDLEDTDD